MLTVFFCLATIWSSQHHQLHGFGQHQVCKHLKWFSVCLLPPCGKTIFFILLVLAETVVLTTCSVVMVLTSIAKHVCMSVCVWCGVLCVWVCVCVCVCCTWGVGILFLSSVLRIFQATGLLPCCIPALDIYSGVLMGWGRIGGPLNLHLACNLRDRDTRAERTHDLHDRDRQRERERESCACMCTCTSLSTNSEA